MVWYGCVAWRVLQLQVLQVTASPNRLPFCPRNKRGVDLFDNKFFGVLGRARNSTNIWKRQSCGTSSGKKIRRLWKNDLFSSKFKFKEYYSKHGFWVGFCCSEFKGWGIFVSAPVDVWRSVILSYKTQIWCMRTPPLWLFGVLQMAKSKSNWIKDFWKIAIISHNLSAILVGSMFHTLL